MPKNRDEKTCGAGCGFDPEFFMNREMFGRSFATWLKKRLSFGRRKRDVLTVRAGATACVGTGGGIAKNCDVMIGVEDGGGSAALVTGRKSFGRTSATSLKKRLSLGRKKRDVLTVRAGVAGCVGAVGGLATNLDARIPGNGGGRAATVAVMNREIRWRTCATWLKKRLSFGRRKREPLRVSAGAASRGRPWYVLPRAVSRVLRFQPGAGGQLPARVGSAQVLPRLWWHGRGAAARVAG